MDRRERFNDLNVALLAALSGWQAGIWTAMPGILQSFDPDARTATVQIAIQPNVLAPDGSEASVTISVLQDCPVVFPRGGGYELTFPLVENDEGLVVLSSRCIDSWWESGGVQPQSERRMHDLSDGFFLAGVYSKKNKPSVGASAAAAQLRSLDGKNHVSVGTEIELSLNDGSTRLTLDDTLHRVNVTAVGGLWVNGVQVTVP